VQKCETRCVHRPTARLPVTHLSVAGVPSRVIKNELTRGDVQRILLEERAALATPIDFADLDRSGILKCAKGGWYGLLQSKTLPAYAWSRSRRSAAARAHCRW